MKKEDVLINAALSLFIGINATALYKLFQLDALVVLLITFIIIFLFWLGSFINELDKRSKKNLINIKKNKEEINLIKKDLNINERLLKLEFWKDNMKKKAQINIPDLFKIIAVLIFLALFLKGVGVF